MDAHRRADDPSLWILIASPAIWAVHFLLSYATAAVWCARYAGPDGSLSVARGAIAAYTVVALAGVGLVGWRALAQRRRLDPAGSDDEDTIDARRRFLAFTALALSGLSAVAIVYASLAALVIGSCD